MSWYETLDRNLGGLLPGGIDRQAELEKQKAANISGYYGFDAALTGGLLPGGQPVSQGWAAPLPAMLPDYVYEPGEGVLPQGLVPDAWEKPLKGGLLIAALFAAAAMSKR